jgi:hypothetical protein
MPKRIYVEIGVEQEPVLTIVRAARGRCWLTSDSRKLQRLSDRWLTVLLSRVFRLRTTNPTGPMPDELRRGGRVVEGARLESVFTSKA